MNMKKLILLLIILFPTFIFGQQATQIKGTVTESSGETLVGVSVIVQGKQSGTVTDIDGNYRIDAKPGDRIIFSYIGYKKETVTVKNERTINVTLADDQSVLDEVVVVAFGAVKRITMTGSVSAISAKELKTIPTSSVQNTLSGRLPGFFSQQTSGQPGRDASDFFIRGASSLNDNGNRPLIIVDDVQYSYDQLQQININEIQDISILKDASTTAIYGIKGANGVLVVKTRRGEEGRPRITVRLEGGMTTPVRTPKFLGSYQAALLTNEAFINDGLDSSAPFSADALEHFRLGDDPYGYPDVNWYDAVFKKNAGQSNANIDFSGGSKSLRYFVTGGFFSQNGLTRNFKDPNEEVNTNYFFRRFNFRTNLDFDVTSTTKVRLDLSSRFMNINEPQSLNAVGEIYNFQRMAPFSAPMINPNGSWAYHNYFILDSRMPTLNARLSNEGYNRNRRFDSNILFDVNQKLDFITKGLSGMFRVAYSSIDENYRAMRRGSSQYPSFSYNPIKQTYTLNPTANSYAYETYYTGTGINKAIRNLHTQTFLRYNRTFGDHSFNGMFLWSRESRTADRNNDTGASAEVPAKAEGYTATINYSYLNRYILDINGAYNGTDRFGKDNRFGLFPAVAVAWNIGEELFFQDSRIGEKFSMLKLRTSYGLVGSDKTPGNRYLYKQVYNTGSSYRFGEIPTNYASYVEGTLGNEHVSWEKEKKFDVGIDATMLRNKITLTVDYFYNYRYDQLVSRQDVPLILGIGLPRTNVGIVSNRGFDGILAYNDKLGDFGFNTNLVFSYAKNKVIYKAEAEQRYPWLSETGKPKDQPFGYTWIGYYTPQDILDIEAGNPNNIPLPNIPVAAGDLKYADLNGDGIIDDFDKGAIGKPNLQTTTMGYTIAGSYKGFTLSLLFQGSFDYSFSVIGTGIESFRSQFQPVHLKRWTVDRFNNGEDIQFPRLTTSQSTVSSSTGYMSNFWLINAWYVRLKTVDIGYEFSQKVLPSGINTARLYINAYNLFTKTNYDKYQQDPEIKTNTAGDAYMNQRVINLGVQVSF